MRIIGLDIHRVFAEAVALEGAEFTRLGRIGMTREHLAAFAATLKKTDHVIVEATGNATALVEILTPYVARVAVANPLQVYLIAKAKTKTDKIDARVLAQLYAAGFLPEVWVPDEATLARRRQVRTATAQSCVSAVILYVSKGKVQETYAGERHKCNLTKTNRKLSTL